MSFKTSLLLLLVAAVVAFFVSPVLGWIVAMCVVLVQGVRIAMMMLIGRFLRLDPLEVQRRSANDASGTSYARYLVECFKMQQQLFAIRLRKHAVDELERRERELIRTPEVRQRYVSLGRSPLRAAIDDPRSDIGTELNLGLFPPKIRAAIIIVYPDDPQNPIERAFLDLPMLPPGFLLDALGNMLCQRMFIPRHH